MCPGLLRFCPVVGKQDVERMDQRRRSSFLLARYPLPSQPKVILCLKSNRLSPQQTIAHYWTTCKLGEDGMSEVWRATDTKLKS
jgi:hypothetical protein